MLNTVSKRIEFWRDQLQVAFRSGDAKRAAECTRIIEEYSVVTALALTQVPSGENDVTLQTGSAG